MCSFKARESNSHNLYHNYNLCLKGLSNLVILHLSLKYNSWSICPYSISIFDIFHTSSHRSITLSSVINLLDQWYIDFLWASRTLLLLPPLRCRYPPGLTLLYVYFSEEKWNTYSMIESFIEITVELRTSFHLNQIIFITNSCNNRMFQLIFLQNWNWKVNSGKQSVI